jgi:hypothetical protein
MYQVKHFRGEMYLLSEWVLNTDMYHELNLHIYYTYKKVILVVALKYIISQKTFHWAPSYNSSFNDLLLWIAHRTAYLFNICITNTGAINHL